MPDVQEVFRMATQTVKPDPGAPERQHSKQRRQAAKQKMGTYVVVAALVIGAIVFGVATLRGDDTRPAGPSEREPATGALTVDDVAGVWRFVEGPFGGPAPLVSFGTDGTFAIDNGGALDTRPVVRGTYELKGNTVTVTTAGATGCEDGTVLTYTAALRGEGLLELVPTRSGGGGCTGAIGAAYTHVRVSPRSAASMDLNSRGQAEGGAPPSSRREIAGIWLIDDGDHLLRIGIDGTYAIGDDGALVAEPDDIGRIVVEDDGTLTFTSAAGSRTCADGSVTTWRNVLTSGDALAADVPAGACGDVPQGRASWRMISRLD